MTNNDPAGLSDQGGTESGETPTGTLVIRTWHEPDQVPGFRARITFSQGSDDEPSSVATADPDEALRIVRQWFLAQPGMSREA